MVVQQVELLRLVSTTGAATARGLTVAASLRLPLVLLAAGLAVFLPLLAFARVCVVCALAVFLLGRLGRRRQRQAHEGGHGKGQQAGKSEGALPAPETSERGACPIRTVTATHWGHTALSAIHATHGRGAAPAWCGAPRHVEKCRVSGQSARCARLPRDDADHCRSGVVIATHCGAMTLTGAVWLGAANRTSRAAVRWARTARSEPQWTRGTCRFRAPAAPAWR